ncbi:MAG TPA: glycosyltransferase [Chthoniobacteraceae bacterium]|jgi:glycosyltransferase involved in cell wall biosynthesis|nr:glycosyltransferase [Chthoniobacteraceae bacterium]
MKVLLVGNYEPDRQHSMERFYSMLAGGLREEGIEIEVLKPDALLGAWFKNKWAGYFDKYVWFRLVLGRAVAARPGWVVHILDQGNGIWAGWLGGNCVVTCHDLLAIRAARGEFRNRRTGWTGRIFQRMILRGLRKGGRIVCVSDATRRDAERLIGPCGMIPNGLEEKWQPMEAPNKAADAGHLLHVGGDTWYKNRPAVERVFQELRAKYPLSLVTVGPGDNVTDERLRELYATARLLIFPSLEEGFGWPIIEAQACGCPVVTTSKAPMTETGGDAAMYCEEGEWSRGAASVLEMDEARRRVLVAKGIENARRFSVKKMAQAYVEFYKQAWPDRSCI